MKCLTECQSEANTVVQILKSTKQLKNKSNFIEYFLNEENFYQLLEKSRKVRLILYKIMKFFAIPRKSFNVILT